MLIGFNTALWRINAFYSSNHSGASKECECFGKLLLLSRICILITRNFIFYQMNPNT